MIVDLLQHLAQAALFQELCSGDMLAIPGLMTSSRLACLMPLLKEEAASTSNAYDSSKHNAADRSSKMAVTNDVLAPSNSASATKKASHNNVTISKQSSQPDEQPTADADTNGVVEPVEHGSDDQDSPLQGRLLDRPEDAAAQPDSGQFKQSRRAVIFVGEASTANR